MSEASSVTRYRKARPDLPRRIAETRLKSMLIALLFTGICASFGVLLGLMPLAVSSGSRSPATSRFWPPGNTRPSPAAAGFSSRWPTLLSSFAPGSAAQAW